MDLTTVTPTPEVLFRDLSGEGVLLNLKSGRYYGLDAVGTRIWQMLMQGRTLASTIAQLLSEYEVSREQLEADIACFIDALEAHGLVVRVRGRSGGDPAPR
jgi:coenzyme PQQ synthesis protein D (PqqD)